MTSPSTSSGLKSANAQICNGPSRLMALQVIGGSAISTVTVYDGTSNAGLVLAKFSVPIAGLWTDHFGEGVIALTGIYAEVSGAGAAYVAHFSLGG